MMVSKGNYSKKRLIPGVWMITVYPDTHTTWLSETMAIYFPNYTIHHFLGNTNQTHKNIRLWVIYTYIYIYTCTYTYTLHIYVIYNILYIHHIPYLVGHISPSFLGGFKCIAYARAWRFSTIARLLPSRHRGSELGCKNSFLVQLN